MPELPIYPRTGESPSYELERRLARLKARPAEEYLDAVEEIRRQCASETLRLTRKPGDTPELVESQLSALQAIERGAAESEVLDLELILDVHRLANPGADGRFRTAEMRPQFASARPSPAELVPDRLANLLDWLAAESSRRMFAAERMALWFARFLEIAPFPGGNFRTGHLLVNFFLRVSGYPPVTLRSEESDGIRADVERAMVFDTQPLVRRFSDAMARSMEYCERGAGSAP